MAYFRRLMENLASPWYLLQKAYEIFESDFEVLLEKINPVANTMLTRFVQQDKLRRGTPHT